MLRNGKSIYKGLAILVLKLAPGAIRNWQTSSKSDVLAGNQFLNPYFMPSKCVEENKIHA